MYAAISISEAYKTNVCITAKAQSEKQAVLLYCLKNLFKQKAVVSLLQLHIALLALKHYF